MKILIIGTTDIVGGAAKISWNIKEALRNEGYDVSMFVADKHSDDPKVKIIPRQMWRKYLGFLLATDDLISSDWIINTPEFKEADIIHCHNLHGRFFNLSTLQKMSKIKPVVWTLHDEWAITPHCAYTLETKKMKNGLYVCPSIDTPPRLLWNNSDRLAEKKNQLYRKSELHVVSPSNWLLERVKNTILVKQDLRLIPNGIDTKIFQKTDQKEAREKLNLPLDKRIILFLADDAKNNPWKGWKYIEEVIKHFKNRDDLFFLSVGNHIQHQSESGIKHAGYVKDDGLLSLYYSAADVLLFTSLAENFPLVILEAMSVGLPIVAFDVGGVKEVLTHRDNGFVAGYKKADELIEGLNWILGLSAKEMTSIRNNSISKIKERYNLRGMIDSYFSLYKELYDKVK